jgi:drug/metabolite transporter (DMT)-like permease
MATSSVPAVHRRRDAYLILAGLAFVWGVHWAIVKIGLGYMPPLTYATLRVAGGLITLSALLGARGRLHLPPRGDMRIVLVVGVGQMAVTIALMNLALQFVPAGRSSILQYTMPLWVVVAGWLAYRAKLSRTEVVGVALGLAGVAVLLNPAAIDWGSARVLGGSAMLLGAAAIWGVTTMVLRGHRWQTSPLELTPWELLVAVVPLALLAVVFETSAGHGVRWEPATVLVLLYSGPLATAFGYWASQSITRALSPLGTTIGFLGVPVVGLAAGAVILGERLSILDVVGFAIVAAGIAAVSMADRDAGVATSDIP